MYICCVLEVVPLFLIKFYLKKKKMVVTYLGFEWDMMESPLMIAVACFDGF